MGVVGAAIKGFGRALMKGKKATGAIKSVKPQIKYTGTKSLIDKFKTAVKDIKSTPEVIKRKIRWAYLSRRVYRRTRQER